MTRFLAAILVISLSSVGCASRPEARSDPLAKDAQWNAANARMEQHFEESALPETLDVPIEALEHVLSGKVERHQQVREQFEALYATNDLTVRSAATLRVGQVELNLACELALMAAPADYGASEAELMREVVAGRTSPYFAAARRFIAQAARMGESPYAQAARDLIAKFPPAEQPAEASAFCESSRAAWSRAPTVGFDARMVSRCEAGNPSACYVASLIVENKRLAEDYAARACLDGIPEACAARTDEKTCEAGNREECWRKAANLESSELESYTRYCFAGSGFDCFKRGLLLESENELRDKCLDVVAQKEGSLSAKQAGTDAAREACNNGEVEGCFALGVATYTTPRELEKAPKTEATRKPPPQDRAEVIDRCIQSNDTSACAVLATSFERDEGDEPVCAARLMFEACRPANPEWCELFNLFEND